MLLQVPLKAAEELHLTARSGGAFRRAPSKGDIDIDMDIDIDIDIDMDMDIDIDLGIDIEIDVGP